MIKNKRLFIAIDMSPAFEQVAGHIHDKFEHKKLLQGRWVHPKQMHLTLKFLGEIKPELLATIQKKLSEIRFSQFDMSLNGLGVFQHHKELRILYLEFVSKELAGFVARIESSLLELIPAERKPFVPHVTIARIAGVPNEENLLQEIAYYKLPDLTVTVDSFVLKESILKHDGVEYWDVARFELTNII